MQLSKQAIEDLKAIALKQGFKLTDSEVNDIGLRLLKFYKFKYLKK